MKNREDREKAKQGLRNILAFLEIVEGAFPVDPPYYCFETEMTDELQADHPSPTSGIFISAVDLWEPVEQGGCLGWIRHPDGTVLAKVNSARSGRVLFMRTLPRVFSGDFLVYVIALPDGVE